MLVSKRFNDYPRFSHCNPELGGKLCDLPAEINEQLKKIAENPTGKVVRLC
jgi:hypothetical protein